MILRPCLLALLRSIQALEIGIGTNWLPDQPSHALWSTLTIKHLWARPAGKCRSIRPFLASYSHCALPWCKRRDSLHELSRPWRWEEHPSPRTKTFPYFYPPLPPLNSKAPTTPPLRIEDKFTIFPRVRYKTTSHPRGENKHFLHQSTLGFLTKL
jgi:hypothetical protein